MRVRTPERIRDEHFWEPPPTPDREAVEGALDEARRLRRVRVKTPERRAYLLMCSYGDMSARELAKHLDIDRDTAHDLIHRLFMQRKVLHSTEGARWTPKVPF